nr:hypothetical protein [Tanacetum cinerariifolium]
VQVGIEADEAERIFDTFGSGREKTFAHYALLRKRHFAQHHFYAGIGKVLRARREAAGFFSGHILAIKAGKCVEEIQLAVGK